MKDGQPVVRSLMDINEKLYTVFYRWIKHCRLSARNRTVKLGHEINIDLYSRSYGRHIARQRMGVVTGKVRRLPSETYSLRD